jgi:hemolysin activation/secretion protein
MKNQTMTKHVQLSLCLLLGGISIMGGVMAQETAATVAAEPRLDVARYRVEGDTLLSEVELTMLLAPFVGEKRSLKEIEQAARTLEMNLHRRGYVFHRVFIPAQKPTQGEVVFQVIRFNLANINVVGNEHFSAGNIRRSLPALQEGAAPDMANLGRDLSAANANPAKQAAVAFREGKKPETVDAEVRVKDAEPLNFFAGYTANRAVDPLQGSGNLYRATLGVQHSNLFDLDHVVTLSYTTDPRDLGKATLLGAYYQAPIYGTGLNLSGYYTYSDVSSGRIQQGAGFFDVSGKGEFFGLRLTQALPRVGTAQQTVSVAIDERYFENSTTFSGTQIQPNVGSRPLSFKYIVRQDEAWGGYGANVEYAINLGGGASNNGANYRLNGADFAWDAWRYGADLSIANWGWNFAGRLRGQWSDNALISGEQLGLGGANSVRGFADREVSGDYGYYWNIEAKGPAVLMPQLRPIFFIDGGDAHSRALHHAESLLSVGGGLRWSAQQFETSMDLARVLDGNSANPEDIRIRLHFSLFYKF